MSTTRPESLLAAGIVTTDRSARAIAAAVGRAIRSGTLAPGVRLPPVRSIARDLGVSPTTVSEAWRELGRIGAIETRGRNGTFVRAPDPVLGPRRYRRVTGERGAFGLDLSTGTPDPALLPDLAPALGRAAARGELTASYADDPVLAELGEIVRARWPFAPGALTVVDGAMDALDRVLRETVRLGDRVVVEDPTFPPLLDLLDVLGAEAIPVALDPRGVGPSALRGALADARPRAMVLQPRAQNPTGASLDRDRVDELAAVLRDHDDVLVIEDDHSGDIASAAVVSVGLHLPDRTVTILGFSKSHGPDLRLAAIGGAAGPVEAVATRRQLGPGWSSRLLQATLADLLADPVAIACVARARAIYADRRHRVAAALADRGVALPEGDGFNLWIPVADEQHAQVALAARGIGVAPGAPFRVSSEGGSGAVRVTVARIEGGEAADLGAALAAAAAPPASIRRA